MEKFEESEVLFEEKVISIRRVTKVVKGGKNLRFSAAVVVGDKKGKVGLGTGKAREVPLAIKKAVTDAKKNLINVPVVKGTIPYYTIGEFGGARVVLRPAAAGTGVIAGGSVRVLMELAGIHNILTKSLKSKNTLTVARATICGLNALKNSQYIKEKRSINEEQLWQ